MFVRAAALVLGLASLLFADVARSQPDEAAREPERVVVFPLAGELSASDRPVFDALLLSELRAAKALELVPADVRQVHVEATRALGIACEAGAEASRECALEVGRLAAARWAIIGTSSSDPREVRLTLIDVPAEASAREGKATLPPSGESLSPVLKALVTDLLQPTAAGRDVVSGADPVPGPTAESAGDPTLWWIGGGSLLAAGTLLALAATGSFVAGAGQEAPLKAGEDPDDRLAAREGWYAAGVTLAVLGGAAVVAGAVLAAMGGVVAAE